MRKQRGIVARCFKDQHVLVGIRKMVLSTNDVADSKISIIRARSQMISWHPVRAQQCKVFDVIRRLHLLAIHRIAKLPLRSTSSRDAEPQRKCLSSRRAPVALFL